MHRASSLVKRGNLLICVAAMLILGCHPRGGSSIVIPDDVTHGITLRCHYLLDEKYADAQAPERIAAWKASMRAEASHLTSAHYDLFSHQGGGPNGAEWNSDGDLFILALAPYRASEVSQVALFLNRKPWKGQIDVDSVATGTLIAITVPGPVWSAHLKSMDKGNEAWMKDAEDPTTKPQRNQSAAPVCDYLEIELQILWRGIRTSVIRSFQWAGGE